MLRALNAQGELVGAQRVTREEARQMICPGCRQPVLLRRGEQVIAHFAHLAGQCCDFESEAESKAHLQAKIKLAKLFRSLSYDVELEYYLPAIKQRADLLVSSQGKSRPFEIQCSALNLRRLKERNTGYKSLNMEPLWVLGPYFSVKKRLSALQLACLFEKDDEPSLATIDPIHDKIYLFSNFKAIDRSARLHYSLISYELMSGQLLETQFNHYSPVSPTTNRKYFSHSLYFKADKIRPLCQRLYEKGKSWLDLPDIIFQTLPSEWLLDSVPEHWKWDFMHYFLKHSKKPITKRRLKIWETNSAALKWHYLPFLTEKMKWRPIYEWLEVLSEIGWVVKKGKNLWVVKK